MSTRTQPQKPQHKLGIVLSGGGAKGYAHIGVLKALEEYHIHPTAISATSMGALIGCLYAAGFSAHEILSLISNKSWTGFIKLSWSRKAIFSLNKVREELSDILQAHTFESLNKTLFINVSNLTLAREETYSKGPLIDVVMASCAIPVVFEPVELNQYQYVDGALYNNFHIAPLTHSCKTLIGSHCNPITPASQTLSSIWDIAERSLNIAVAHNAKSALQACDWLIEPTKLNAYSIWDFNKVEEIAQIGYEYALQAIKQLPDLHELTPS